MSLRVLGCSGAIAAGARTTSFLLDEHVLVDAGTGLGDLPLEALSQIDHVLLSHSHLDHVLGVPLLADATLRQRRHQGRGPITVHALPATLQALQEHLLNGVLWPDFTQLPTTEAPALRLQALAVGDTLDLHGRTVRVLPAAHTVPACGFAIRGQHADRWTVFTGDTGPNPALWAALRDLPLAQLIIEVAFSDEECALAQRAGHHCPASLAAELLALPPSSAPIWLTHLKPGEEDAIVAQLHQRAPQHAARLLHTGQVLALDTALDRATT
jgi:ribonuclease BN (tRNA processing enzyme)